MIEGNKGLFDGVDPEGGDSNAALARLLGAPVVLVIDTMGMTRGIAPLVLGYRNFDAEVRIAGAILNKVGGPRHEGKLRAALERYTDIPVLGAVQRDAALEIPERHLGLIPANEVDAASDRIDRLAAAVAEQVDVDTLLEVAASAGAVVADAPDHPPTPTPVVRIGIARDAAFGFYYADDLEALTAAGAELVPFDTLSDQRLPRLDGLFIGGGFPETKMAALEANASLRAEIKSAIEGGLPTYAECGGLLYLARSLAWKGERRRMVGVVPADAVINPRPQGRGYMRLDETADFPWPILSSSPGAGDAVFPAHEFHYASLDDLPPDLTFAYRVRRGAGIDGNRDGIVLGNLLASFCHRRDTVADRWAARFVAFVRDRASRR